MTAGKAIFITGAGAGIGAETARLFARNGWRVGASDVNAAALVALQGECGADRVSIHAADVRDRAAVASALGEFTKLTAGRLDVLFANAGVLFMGPDETITPAQKELLVDVNVKGVIHTIDAGFPWLAKTPGAHLVAMASTSAEARSVQRIFSVRLSIEPVLDAGLHRVVVDELPGADVFLGLGYGSQKGDFLAHIAEVGIVGQPLDGVQDLFFDSQSRHGNRIHDSSGFGSATLAALSLSRPPVGQLEVWSGLLIAPFAGNA